MKVTAIIGVALALACVVSLGFWTVNTLVSELPVAMPSSNELPEKECKDNDSNDMTLPLSNELPEGYIVQGKLWTTDETGDIVNEEIIIFRRSCRLELGQTHTDEGVKMKFCGFSDLGEIYLSINDSDLLKLTMLESSIPNSNFYVSYFNKEPEPKRNYIHIGWDANIQKGKSITLSSGKNITFLGFDKNMEATIKVD